MLHFRWFLSPEELSSSNRLDLVPAFPVPMDEQYFADFTTSLYARFFIHENHEIHSFSDELLLRCIRCLGNEALESDQTFQRIVSMYSRGSTGMPCVPRLQQRVRFRTAHFADNYSCGL